MKVLIIDNFDSFTFNLYQIIGSLLSKEKGRGARLEGESFEVTVKRNNEITVSQAQALQPDRILISPGPGQPSDPQYFGVCADIILNLGKTIPLMGVCLGMQGIAHCFGAKIEHAKLPMHGRISAIRHDGKGLYRELPQGLEAMRYHSLVVRPDSIPDCLVVTSLVFEGLVFEGLVFEGLVSEGLVSEGLVSDDLLQKEAYPDFSDLALHSDAEIMGLRHKDFPIEGIQFHPESFGTEGGTKILENFLFTDL